jgi:chitodextrinase
MLGAAPTRASLVTAAALFVALLTGGGNAAANDRPSDRTPPSTPTALVAAGAGQTSISISWTASTDNVGVTGYRLFRSGSQVGTSATASDTFTGLSCGSTYILSVAALDAAGNQSPLASITAPTQACTTMSPSDGGPASAPDKTAPTAPTGVSASATGQTSISLSWTASTDNVGVTGYRLFSSGAQVGSSSTTSYTLTGLTCGATYILSVAAVDAAGNQSTPASVTAKTQACAVTTAIVDKTPPTVPTQLTTSTVGQTGATLSWTASTDNVGVKGYRVYLGGGLVTTSASNSYTFFGLTCGTNYTLGVSAFDAAGNASAQATVTLATAPCSTQLLGSSAASLWVAPGGRSSCVRAAVPVGYAAALAGGNVCDSGPSAYVRAQPGDTVLVQGGTYTSSWNFTPQISKQGAAGSCNYNYGGTANLSGCVSFVPAPGQSVSFQVAGTNTAAIRICANFVSIRGVTINQTTSTDQYGDQVSNSSVSVGAGDSSCMPGGAAPHDIYLSNINYGGQASAVGGASNVWFVGGTATGATNLDWQMGGQGGNGATGYVNHNGVVGMTFQGGSFLATDPAHHHMECIHDIPGSDHIVIASSQFLSCPVESVFFQGSSQTNILVENNYFINGGPLKFDCTTNGCINQNITVRYNTFQGATLLLQNACNKNGTCSGATIDNNLVYGNVGLGCTAIAVNFGLNGSSGSGWTFQNSGCTTSSSSTSSSSAGSTTTSSTSTSSTAGATSTTSSTIRRYR